MSNLDPARRKPGPRAGPEILASRAGPGFRKIFNGPYTFEFSLIKVKIFKKFTTKSNIIIVKYVIISKFIFSQITKLFLLFVILISFINRENDLIIPVLP